MLLNRLTSASPIAGQTDVPILEIQNRETL